MVSIVVKFDVVVASADSIMDDCLLMPLRVCFLRQRRSVEVTLELENQDLTKHSEYLSGQEIKSTDLKIREEPKQNQ